MMHETHKMDEVPAKALLLFFLSLWQPMVSAQASAYDDACQDWFDKAKVKQGPQCLVDCAMIVQDFATLGCPERCSAFCKEPPHTKALFKLSALYGLTNSERVLVAKEPVRALKAYALSWRAETLCERLYVSNQMDDESDACRHFVWAALLTRDLGLEFATTALNAHEDDPHQSKVSRAMDLANNRLGQIKMQSLKDRSDESIIKSYQINLKQKALVILKPLKPGNELRLK